MLSTPFAARRRPLFALLLVAVAGTASAQCYQFSGSGATLKVNIALINFQQGPTFSSGGFQTNYLFTGDNTFTLGGATLTSTSLFTGALNIQYLPPIPGGGLDITTWEIVVPNSDPPGPGTHDWIALLEGSGNIFPSGTITQTLPGIGSWFVQGGTPTDYNYIEVRSGSSSVKFPITSIRSCTNGLPPINGKTLGDPTLTPGDCGCGDPINIGNGNLFEQFTDYASFGQNPLSFTRSYNSLAGATTFATSLGANWRTNYDRYLRLVSGTSVIAERPEGGQVAFTLSGSNWITDSDVDLKLVNSGSNWTLTDSKDTQEIYSAVSATEALLQSIQSRNGYTITPQYGANNQLNSVSDSYHRSVAFTYQNGLLHTATTPDGLVITYGYTGGGQLASAAYSGTPATMQRYVYENSDLPTALTGIVDENGGRYATWTYDGNGRALTSQHAGGADLTTVVYNDGDGSRTVTNPLGLQEIYKFTTLQGIPKVTEADRPATSSTAAATSLYTYDSNGFTASHTDWNGTVTTYVNDPHGQPLTITEAAGTPQARLTTTTYHPVFHLPAQIATPGLTANFTYDANGQLLTRTLTDTTTNTAPYSTNGETRTWTYTWSNFLLTSIQSPRTDLSSITKVGYDASGATISITNALNQVTQVTQHNASGLPLAWTDPAGVTYTHTFDSRLRVLTRTINAASGALTTRYTYDGVGNLLTTTLPDGSVMTNTYDAAHRLTGTTDALHNAVAYTLDAMGDRTLSAVADPNGTRTRQRAAAYDALGRFTRETDGAGQVTSVAYDAVGAPLAVTDPLQHGLQEGFDPLSRLVQLTDAQQGIVSLTYDARNHPVSITDPKGIKTLYVFNGFGDVIQQVSPAAGTTIYVYDSAGNQVERVDGRGSVVDFTYDALNRVTSEGYLANASENVIYTYDQTGAGFGLGIGRLTSISDAAGTLTRSYDERGNVLAEARTRTSRVPAVTLRTTYTYDKAGRVSSITYPSGSLLAYTRDAAGRISGATVKPPGANQAVAVVSNVSYQPFGPISSFTYGNGISEIRSFDLDYRMTAIRDTGNAPVLGLTYGYDAASNATLISDSVTTTNTQHLGYDALNRLTNASGSYGNLTYTYDGSGNRITDALATADGLGSMTTLAYNQAGRLASANAGPLQLTQYTYDAFGRRVEKISNLTTVTMFAYDVGRLLLEETDAQGNFKADYVYLDGRPVATLAPGGSVYFLHDDRLGTPQTATDSSQKVVWVGSYLPFGALNGAASQTSTLAQDLRLPGQEVEQETGLYHNGHREYAPSLGRYVQSDPIGMAGGLNPYAYVENNPLNAIDPLGLCSLTGVNTTGQRGILTFSDGSTLIVPDWTTLTEGQQMDMVIEAEQYTYEPPDYNPLVALFEYLGGIIGKNDQANDPCQNGQMCYGSLGIRG